MRRVGYSLRNGAELWSRPEIRARVEELIAEREAESRLKAFRVLDELATLAMSSIEHYDIDDLGRVHLAPGAPDGAMAAVSSVKRRPVETLWPEGPTLDGQPIPPIVIYETEIRLWDKNPALTNALHHLGLLKDKLPGAPVQVNVTTNVNVAAVVELTPQERELRLSRLGYVRVLEPSPN